MIRKLLVASISAAVLLSVTACAFTQGVKPDASVNTSFVKGVSTLSDVEAKLGQPMKTVTNSDGSTTVTFHYGEAHLGALAFVGVAGATGQDIITVVNFDKRGKFIALTQETDNRNTSGL
ncbi:hypothetical protein [Paraburkholderia humisilvae]|uniref:Lipoprotein SmpA/OmlA domain-containing protein n=1 Tax=Paraburkholderia humisilvae TaxID=627669 RepID=A0A6J5DLL9_9BURK|nr:hypothetical protein [Paraburkholderia humisilvae]CAB3754374.1 hypothetical protein LMG29542_02332 [Paraburkholderia humisilvae]